MKLRDFLTEAKITTKDRRELTNIITNKRVGKFRLDDGSLVEVSQKGKKLNLTFSKDNDDLIFALTSICDTLGLSFDYRIKNNEMHFTIEV